MVSPRPLQHEYVANAALDVNWDHIVRLLHLFELGVNEGFIQIEDKGLFAPAVIGLRPQETLISSKSRLGANV